MTFAISGMPFRRILVVQRCFSHSSAKESLFNTAIGEAIRPKSHDYYCFGIDKADLVISTSARLFWRTDTNLLLGYPTERSVITMPNEEKSPATEEGLHEDEAEKLVEVQDTENEEDEGEELEEEEEEELDEEEQEAGVAQPINVTEKAEEYIPADVRLFSGCMDSQTSADVSDTASFRLPDPAGKAGGACTSAMLQVLYADHTDTAEDLTFEEVMLKVRDNLDDNFTQVSFATASL